MALGAVAWLVGLRLLGIALAYSIAERIVCAAADRGLPQRAGAAGGERA